VVAAGGVVLVWHRDNQNQRGERASYHPWTGRVHQRPSAVNCRPLKG
jgi:hypothetical protein